jgi:hypothetical protein
MHRHLLLFFGVFLPSFRMGAQVILPDTMTALLSNRGGLEDVRTDSVFHEGPLEIQYLTLPSEVFGRITLCRMAYDRMKPRKAILFLHGGGQTKRVFEAHARILAKDSFVCLLVDAPPARPEPWRRKYLNYTNPSEDLNAYCQSVRDLRRCVDYLQDLGMETIHFMGLSKGAWTGAALASVETRIDRFILMAATGSHTYDLETSPEKFISGIRNSLTVAQRRNYVRILRPLDVEVRLNAGPPGRFLFQFAENDPYVSDALADRAFSAAKGEKQRRSYPCAHDQLIDFPAAATDRIGFLKN